MAVNLSPIGNGISFLNNLAEPLSGGKIYTYQAGSSTPLATYTDFNGTVANSNPIVLAADGRVPDEIWLTYGYNYKFVIKDANDVTIQTLDNLYGILGTIPAVVPTLPTGMILMWSGSLGSIPSGYYLCDGNNGTPDLRNRFIVGAGDTYAVGNTGGSADAITVAHTHTATSTTTATDSGHTHTSSSGAAFVVRSSGSNAYGSGNLGLNDSIATGHANITASTSTTVASSGTSGTNANLPPYYALAYIMKA